MTRTRNEIIQAVTSLNKPDEEVATSETSLAKISKMLLEIQAEVDEAKVHHRILRQLVFKDMNSRANHIHEAAPDTYTWTLEDGPVNKGDRRSHTWQIFLKWLRVGDNILQVSGNPGSGKSTLMKFLFQHHRTKRELTFWAGGKKLICCVFYFWNSGSEAQRTLSGLYRSLLFQSLSQCPELIREVFPLQSRRIRDFTGDAMVEEVQSFDEDHIEDAFNLLLDRAYHGGYRLCFFIDGLDECEGNRLQHENLVLMLQSWTGSGVIKLCVSSRPYSEFTEPLNIPETRLVHLHELNKYDIEAYCLGRFQNDMYARKRDKLCQELAETVVSQARGVFLWVYLVVDILLIGLRQADSDSILWAQLNALPRDLDQLYTRLREPIEADIIQRDRSSRMLLLAARIPEGSGLTAVALSWLEEQDCDQGGLMNPDFPQASGMKPYSQKEIFQRVENVTKQINGLARGFLEVNSRTYYHGEGEIFSFFQPGVHFCHRTARDYLLHNKDRHNALLNSFPNFEKSDVYINILLAETIHGYDSKIAASIDIFDRVDWYRSARSKIDPDLVGKFKLPLRDLVPPLSIRLFSRVGLGVENWDHQQAQASFTEYAAYCGLSQYVLREVATDATKLEGTTSCGNVILAALVKEQYDLCLELLRLSRGKKQLCVVWDDQGNVQSPAPTYVLAVSQVLKRIVGTANAPPCVYFYERHWDLCQEILRIIVSMEISMRITIRGIDESHGDAPHDDPEGLQVQIGIAEVLQLLEGSMFPRSEHFRGRAKLEYWNFNSSMLKEMSIARLGQVIYKDAGTTHGLKGWPDQTHPFFKHGAKDQRTYMEKLEWALDNRDFVEIKGWVRLY